ncbi:hypothetical protein J2Z83_001965 [Virgibacillus natechei]|uniref:Uncharacterized protein n=1 Tax=Virgibacillus natechei TaxID=1216297 RepID=A0ABS4IFZ6_9BACI|nr:hypothetical protein [Virgibacillus natechei]MBP1969857.1 hypothetical protein [Virgibacillus natechei]UZD12612.1 hypothetical protein OLD84_17210 [Virgibacillus natechei]
MLLFTGLISACSTDEEVTEHRYLFTGGGDYWSAELEYEAEEVWGKDADDVNTYSSESDYVFKLTYKGELAELASMEQLDYKFTRGTTGEGISSITFDEPVSDKEFTSRGGGTGAIMREDMIVNVEVNWDDNEESFELVESR